MNAQQAELSLNKLANEKRRQANLWFFKTGPGEYGEGDEFIGVSMPNIRKVVKDYKDLDFDEIQILLDSKVHEVRMLGLLILVHQFERKGDKKRFMNFI